MVEVSYTFSINVSEEMETERLIRYLRYDCNITILCFNTRYNNRKNIQIKQTYVVLYF